MIKGILIDTKTGKHTITEVEDELKEFYRILDCDYIDIPSRKIGDTYFDIYCDDEGLFKPDPVVTVIDITDEFDNKPMIVGNIFICQHDGEGGARSLTEEEITFVEFHIVPMGYAFENEDGEIDLKVQDMLLATY